MSKIFVVLGKTLAGKSSLIKAIEDKTEASRVITFTNRPKRDGEISGVDYYFVTHDQALSFILGGHSIANRHYKPHESVGGVYPWYYGVLNEDLREDGDKYLITDLEGLKEIKEYYDVTSIYLHITPSVQKKRMKSRGDDLSEETLRRIEDDERVFEGFQNKADFVVNVNQSIEEVAQEVLEIINAR